MKNNFNDTLEILTRSFCDLSKSYSSLCSIEFKMSPLLKSIIDDPYNYGIEQLLKKDFYPEIIKHKIKYYQKPSVANIQVLDFQKYDELAKQLIIKIKNKSIEVSNLRKKEIRYLVNYLSLVKDEPELFIEITNLITKSKILTSYFMAYLCSYYQNYKQILSDNSLIMLYKEVLTNYINNKSNYIPKTLENFNIDILFTENLPKDIAMLCIQNYLNLGSDFYSSIREYLPYISIDLDLCNLIIEHIGYTCYENINKEGYQNLLVKEILTSSVIQKTTLDSIVSKIIRLFGEQKVNENIQQKIKNALISNDNYGDPRIQRLQWANVDKEAVQIFITWLAKDDLEFFFKFIFKDKSDKQQRENFWTQYINSRSLVESCVILSEIDYEKWINLPKEHTQNRLIKRFKTSDEASCFILEFANATIVEFSIENHALYVYDTNVYRNMIADNICKQSDLKTSASIRISKKDFFKYNSYEIPIKEKAFNKDLKTSKVFCVYHTLNKIPNVVRTKYTIDWHFLTERLLSHLAIYPGDN